MPQGTIDWAGLESQYFYLRFRPQEALWSSLELQGDTEEKTDSVRMQSDDQTTIKYFIWSGNVWGPKDIMQMNRCWWKLRGSHLGSWLGPIARDFKTLRLYNWFGNYGWAIIFTYRHCSFDYVSTLRKSRPNPWKNASA